MNKRNTVEAAWGWRKGNGKHYFRQSRISVQVKKSAGD